MKTSSWILVGTIILCFMSLTFIPLIVMFIRKRDTSQHSTSRIGEVRQRERTVINCVDQLDLSRGYCYSIWKSLALNTSVCLYYLLEIAEPDEEIAELNRLIIPLVTSSVITNLFQVIAVGLVGNFVGTEAVIAFTVTDSLLSITDAFVKGLPDAENTICSHAIGNNNYFLAGQYVQITVSIYIMYSIPTLTMWWFLIEDVFSWMGFSSSIAVLASSYTKVAIFHILLEGIGEAFMALLDISGHATYGTVIDILEGLLSTVAVCIAVLFVDETSLASVALIYLFGSFLSLTFAFTFALSKGWLDMFLDGIFKNIAMKNTSAVQNLLYSALPLGLGSLFTYGEWEILTLFVTHMGPTSVAAWAILSSVWDLFESSSEGCSEAAAIRVAFHLGNSDPGMAKISAYKSILLVIIVASISTSIFFICGEDLPSFFTQDDAIQHEIAKVLPLMGIGNLTMSTGVLAWFLIGAQNRFCFATCLTVSITFVVTLPLAGISVFVLEWPLESVVASVVIGYSTATTILSSILITSDWRYLSNQIVNTSNSSISNHQVTE